MMSSLHHFDESIGAYKPKNMIHVIINNSAHETVGGMPTVAGQIDLVAIAKACGYPKCVEHNYKRILRFFEQYEIILTKNDPAA